MPTFQQLWNAHPGHTDVCDKETFGNQCAMRMSTALRAVGANLTGLRTCVEYDRRRFGSHAPGHVRAAQDVANHFYRVTSAKGLGATSFNIWDGTINGNMASLRNGRGMLFIQNGWDDTDHIDVWRGDGSAGTLKGGDVEFFGRGQKIWFWGFA